MKLFDICHKINHINLFAAMFLVISIIGCNPSQTAPPEANLPEVAVVELKPEKVMITTQLPGRISAFLTAEVRPQVGGIIQKRFFEEGADVKENQQLYEIDPAPYQALYDKCKADLSKAEARIVSLKYKYERNKALIKAHSVSQQEYDNSEAEYLSSLADIQSWKAALESAKINLDYTKIKAPISGRIGKSDVTVGALVIAYNPESLAVIQQINPIYVDVVQSSSDFLKYKRNIEEGFIKQADDKISKVKLLFEDGSLYGLEGELKFRDISVDKSTGSFILRVVFPNPQYTLLPGMFARCVIDEGEVDNAILVPHQALKRNLKGAPIAYIVDSTGKVEERSLILDHSFKDKWLVKSGLKSGDKLIVEGFQRIRPGALVKTVNFEAQSSGDPAQKTSIPPKKN